MRSAAVLSLLIVLATSAWADDYAALRQRVQERRMQPVELRVVAAEGGAPLATTELIFVRQQGPVAWIGANLFMLNNCGTPELNEQYAARFAELCNFGTVPFYWWSYEPEQGETKADEIWSMCRWAARHHVRLKGHPLFWNWQDPTWLPDDPNAVRQLALERITDCVTRFGKPGPSAPGTRDPWGTGMQPIIVWDVVNEATNYERAREQAPKTTGMWTATGRNELINAAFDAARKANPRATLLINDYDTSAKYEELIRSLKRPDGTFPFDAIGIQSHMHGGVWDSAKVHDVCQRFGQFGLPLHFTEMTILSGENGWNRPQPWESTPEGEQAQAEAVERVYLELLAEPQVEAITWWDLSDRGAWMGAPGGLLRADMTPKPAYEVIKKIKCDLLPGVWDSRTDAHGGCRLHLWPGKYRVYVKGNLESFQEIEIAAPPAAAPAPLELKL